jgi:dTMP kinase
LRGLFISFEGIEGTGKTTQARILAGNLKGKGYEVVITEEPGGTYIGRQIREVLLDVKHKEMHHITELLLYNASRSQHINELILPAINEGKLVVTDRFSDSTTAYQGYGRGIDLNLIDSLDRITTGNLRPDITFLLDIDVETGLRRNRGANKVDRMELENINFHQRVRSGFLELAGKEPERIKVIDASGGMEDISNKIIGLMNELLQKSG